MTTPTAPPLRFGVIGCGGAAVDFARGVRGSANATIVAVHDRDAARAADLGRDWGATVHPTLRALLENRGVDAAYVALPHDRLAPTAGAALRAGLHVLVEKPAGTTLAALDRVRAAALTADRRVGVLFEHRSRQATRTATDLVRGGAIGDVRLVRIRTLIDKPPAYWLSGPTGRVRDPWRTSPRRAGGGVVIMNSIHQIDLVRAITALEVESVAARISCSVPGVRVEDVAVAAIAYRGGAIGSLVASAHAPGASRAEEIEIDGADGSLVLPDPYGPPRPLRLYLRRPWRDHGAGRWIEIERAEPDAFVTAVDAFVAAVAAGADPVPGLADARAALATVLAIYAAARRSGSSVGQSPSLGRA